MSNINKDAVLNPFSDLTANILDYVPRATTSEFGIVAIGSGINVDALGRIYLDTQEYSDRLTAIEAQAASSLATQQTEVAAAIAQVNLAQSQTITALTLEVDNLKTDLTARADQLAQDVTDITQQLTQDKAAFTQEIQDALVYLENASSVASALRTPRKIQGVDFDGTQDISLPVFTAELDGLVPKRVGATSTKYLREDGTWVVPPDTTYALLTAANAEAGTATSANSISAKVLKDAIKFHAPTATDITGNAATATKLQTARTITLTGKVTGSASFDGSTNASIATEISGLGVANGIATLDSSGQVPSTQLPSYVDDVLEYANVAAFPTTGVTGKIYVETTGNTTYRWSGSAYVKITSGEVSSVAGKTGVVTLTKSDVGLSNVDNTADSTKNVASAAKLTTARTLTIGRTGKTFDGSANAEWTVTELLPTALAGHFLKFNGTNWIAALDNNTAYSAMSQTEANTGTDTSSRVITAAVLKNAIQTHAPTPTSVTGNAATATSLQTARTINGTSFNGTANITTANWGTARTLTIGSTGKSVDGSANISWSLAEIGAAPESHTHDYLPTSGGTLSGDLSVTGTITASGNITAFSDARLKDNITEIPDALNKLNQLKGVTYTRKDLASDKQYAGLIAQDVQKVLPEAVAVTEDDIIAVDYNGVIGLLVEAIKELETKVAILEGK